MTSGKSKSCQKRKISTVCSSDKGRSKRVKFADTEGKPLVSIRSFFSRSSVCTEDAGSAVSQCPQVAQGSALNTLLGRLIGVPLPQSVISITKENIAAKLNSKVPVSCGNVTVTESDFLTLLPGQKLCDNVSFFFVCNAEM